MKMLQMFAVAVCLLLISNDAFAQCNSSGCAASGQFRSRQVQVVRPQAVMTQPTAVRTVAIQRTVYQTRVWTPLRSRPLFWFAPLRLFR